MMVFQGPSHLTWLPGVQGRCSTMWTLAHEKYLRALAAHTAVMARSIPHGPLSESQLRCDAYPFLPFSLKRKPH